MASVGKNEWIKILRSRQNLHAAANFVIRQDFHPKITYLV